MAPARPHQTRLSFRLRQTAVVTLLVASSITAQLTLPLARDPIFEALPVTSVLDSVFSRWSISLPLTLSPNTLLTKPTRGSAYRRSRHHALRLASDGSDSLEERALLGSVIGLVGTTLGVVDKLVKNVVYDPLFGTNVIKATGERGDTEWYGSLSFGNPPQQIKLNFDTGSADLFLIDPKCQTCFLSNHTAYIPARSRTFSNTSTPWSTTFGDGSGASGYVATDSAWITVDPAGPNTSAQVEVPRLPFAMATTLSSSFGKSTPSGLVGLAQDRLSNIQGGSTVFSRLVASRQLDQNVLGIRLVKGARPSSMVQPISTGGGEYAFGGVLSQWIVGGQAGLTWIPVTSSNYWGIPMTGVQMGGVSIMDKKTPPRAILDTGTTLVVTSQALASAIHAKIPDAYQAKSSVWIVPCNLSSDRGSANYAPNVFFVLGGRRFGIPIQDLAWKSASPEATWCVSGIQSGMEDFTVLGSMFIKNHYLALRYNTDGSLSAGLGDRTDVPPII
ncbi:hypothetical protein FRB99_001337 [Tulasnella sp. 403]|nr:hypothetical protein FRB99_001337 [Tulasnella sp. 403]